MKRRVILGSLSLAGVVAVIALAVVEYQARGTQGFTGSIAQGQASADTQSSPAPSFSIESLDGGTVSLEALRGNVVVVNFWATWCGPCRLEAPAFSRLSREYLDRGVRFLGMNERDDRAAAQAFVREFALDYPSGFDPSGSLADDFGLYAMPTTFVVDQAGIIRYRFTGYVTEANLRTAIDDLLEKVP